MHDFHVNNVNKKHSIVDESFQPGFNNKHFLSIELSWNNFAYCILDSDRFQYRVMESYERGEYVSSDLFLSGLNEIVENNKFLNSGFERITLIYVAPQSVFIPAELYAEEENDTYLEFNHIIENGYKNYSDKLNNLNAYAIYPVPKVLKSNCDKWFNNYRLRHFSTPLIESVLYDVFYAGFKGDIVIHVQKGHFEILILEEGNLRFFNSFNYQTWDDLLYYLFYVIEQTDLSAENTDLLILGQASMDSELYINLIPYFNNVDFGSRSDLFKYHRAFEEIPHHYFYNLLNANACG